ncbi:MAG: 4a-hydroxytetrahydrobiopterin dehydratase [Bacteroidales bacterium]|nr:4a-hydroxytetrahydrobiopterin dehydratase [Bacteroidales bacterium]MCB8999886.1 4a-hydroxytetrahydrobiopterin dehydratase [Bacteroidales bacterium]
MELSKKRCRPCEGGVPKLTSSEIEDYNSQLRNPWLVSDEMKISKKFHFKDFYETMNFVNKIANIAEGEGHHPVMHVYYANLEVELWTHAILGLSENDFILAAKIDELT